MNMTSWKTTSAGILAIVGGLTRLYFAFKAGSFTEEAITTAATAILTGIGLMFARDNNVTSEQVQAAKEAKAEKGTGGFSLFAWLLVALVALVAMGLALTACKAPHLEPGGAYAPTNSVGVVTSNDVGLALADASYKFAYESVVGVFEFERANRAEILKLTPSVKEELDKLRPQVVAVDQRWALAHRAYRANPTPAGLSTLGTILAELQRLLPVVQSQLGAVTAQVVQPANN